MAEIDSWMLDLKTAPNRDQPNTDLIPEVTAEYRGHQGQLALLRNLVSVVASLSGVSLQSRGGSSVLSARVSIAS